MGGKLHFQAPIGAIVNNLGNMYQFDQWTYLLLNLLGNMYQCDQCPYKSKFANCFKLHHQVHNMYKAQGVP